MDLLKTSIGGLWGISVEKGALQRNLEGKSAEVGSWLDLLRSSLRVVSAVVSGRGV